MFQKTIPLELQKKQLNSEGTKIMKILKMFKIYCRIYNETEILTRKTKLRVATTLI